jgi:hypothetical protein
MRDAILEAFGMSLTLIRQLHMEDLVNADFTPGSTPDIADNNRVKHRRMVKIDSEVLYTYLIIISWKDKIHLDLRHEENKIGLS